MKDSVRFNVPKVHLRKKIYLCYKCRTQSYQSSLIFSQVFLFLKGAQEGYAVKSAAMNS